MWIKRVFDVPTPLSIVTLCCSSSRCILHHCLTQTEASLSGWLCLLIWFMVCLSLWVLCCHAWWYDALLHNRSFSHLFVAPHTWAQFLNMNMEKQSACYQCARYCKSEQLICDSSACFMFWSSDFSDKHTLTREWNHLLQCLSGMKPCKLPSSPYHMTSSSLQSNHENGCLPVEYCNIFPDIYNNNSWKQTLQAEGFLWLLLNINLSWYSQKTKDALNRFMFSRAAGFALLPGDEASACTSLGGKLCWMRCDRNTVSEDLNHFFLVISEALL